LCLTAPYPADANVPGDGEVAQGLASRPVAKEMFSDYLIPAILVVFAAWRLFSIWQVRRKVPELLRAGAQIVDVRSPAEYASGHSSAGRNIPLGELETRVKELDPGRGVIVCCASGARSAAARRILRRHGFSNVFNAGSWRRLP